MPTQRSDASSNSSSSNNSSSASQDNQQKNLLPVGSFLHLDLHFERTEDGNVCQVRHSPAGQGESRFVAPFSQRDLQKIWEVLREVQNSGHALATQRALIQDAGRRLFEAAFAGEVLGCLRASFDRTDFMKVPLHIHLDFSGAPELEKLPWEYLYNPERSEFPALSATSPLARYTS